LFALIHDFQDAWMKSRSKTDALHVAPPFGRL
jgi:hypothetical protein